MDNVTESDVFNCLHQLAETDKELARSKANVEFHKHRVKVILADAYLQVKGGTVRDKDAYALTSDAYKQAVKAHRDAVYDYEHVRAIRLRCELTIDVWRSLNSARSKGIVQ